MELYLVRHGQSKANAAHILQGAKVDTALTSKGCQQAELTRERLLDQHFDCVYVSPLHRASETAKIIVGQSTTLTFDPRLVEFDYGSWDGQKIEDLLDQYPEYFHDPVHFSQSWKVSGGERYQQAQTRLKHFMADLNSDADEKVLVVSHGMTIKLWVAQLLGLKHPENLVEPANASVTKISLTNGQPILKIYGG